MKNEKKNEKKERKIIRKISRNDKIFVVHQSLD